MTSCWRWARFTRRPRAHRITQPTAASLYDCTESTVPVRLQLWRCVNAFILYNSSAYFRIKVVCRWNVFMTTLFGMLLSGVTMQVTIGWIWLDFRKHIYLFIFIFIRLAGKGCWHGLEPFLCIAQPSIRLGFALPSSRSKLVCWNLSDLFSGHIYTPACTLLEPTITLKCT